MRCTQYPKAKRTLNFPKIFSSTRQPHSSENKHFATLLRHTKRAFKGQATHSYGTPTPQTPKPGKEPNKQIVRPKPTLPRIEPLSKTPQHEISRRHAVMAASTTYILHSFSSKEKNSIYISKDSPPQSEDRYSKTLHVWHSHPPTTRKEGSQG